MKQTWYIGLAFVALALTITLLPIQSINASLIRINGVKSQGHSRTLFITPVQQNIDDGYIIIDQT